MILPAALSLALTLAATTDPPALIRSVADGPWSAPGTWEGGAVPGEGSRVQVRGGHRVLFDLDGGPAIRSIHVAGTLEFARDRTTRLEVGLIKIQPGDDASENGFDCDAHAREVPEGTPRPELLVGLPGDPVAAGKTATIRLKYFEGMDRETCPGLVDCGGRVELHGQPLKRTWAKLAREAYRNEPIVMMELADVADWKPGDRVVVTGTTRQFGYKNTRTFSVAQRPATEERTIRRIQRYTEPQTTLARVFLDQPLEFDHRVDGDYRAEVANLSRNVVVESADPDGERGHTMVHRNSSGSISYAELRHLGKEGVLGKYALHFHLAGDTLRGMSVVGASIWDSKNRWITIHGTNYLVIRDCVGYKAVGHGFFLEDGTETRNNFDGNLAVMALRGKPLPDQMLPFDKNLGSGFWWANSLDSFTRNVAAECDQEGYRFEVFAGDGFNPVLPVLQPDGTRARVDVRTLPFIRFQDNEAHCMRFFGMNLGGFNDGGVPADPREKARPAEPPPKKDEYARQPSDPRSTERSVRIEDVEGVGPDPQHPFLIRNYRAWDTHWAFHAGSPSVRGEGMDLHDSQYGIWRSVIDHHEYVDLKMEKILSREIFFPRPGKARDDEMAYLDPQDDLPPTTVITAVTMIDTASRRLLVRGTCIDNFAIKSVTLNGRAARPTRPNFAEWEVEIDAPADGELAAAAEDEAGNVEQIPHTMRGGW